MRQIILYTGQGASLTPQYIEGRVQSQYVRLVADEGKVVTDGERTSECVDVLASTINNWTEIDAPEPEEDPTDEEFAEAGRVMMAYERG